MYYSDQLRAIGNTLINDYLSSGNVPGGINGPYNDVETPVRNLSHLIVIASIEKILYNRAEMTDILEKMGKTLMGMSDSNCLYRMRAKDGKDICNGVIGHAWVIEGFIYLFKAIGDKSYVDAAIKAYKKHNYDAIAHLWHRPNYGEKTECDVSIDYTLNHQLWFAASAIELYSISGEEFIMRDCDDFLNNLYKNMWIHDDGLVCHPIYYRSNTILFFKQAIRFFMDSIKRLIKRPSYLYREEGYHSFDVMALARIKKSYPTHRFFQTEKSNRPVMYFKTKHFHNGINNSNWRMDPTLNYSYISSEEKRHNIYAYPYNVTGFELLYISEVYKPLELDDIAIICINEQMKYTYDSEKKKLGKECHDEITCNYRVYEYYRYLELAK